MDRDFFMDVETAIEFGVIDKVLDKRRRDVDDDEEGEAQSEKSD